MSNLTKINHQVPLIEFKGISKSYPRARSAIARMWDLRRTVGLRALSLSVHEGEAVGIVGESGSGKSTLARLAVDLSTPTTGQVRYCGTSLAEMSKSQRQRFRGEVQMVFQSTYASLNPRKTIGRTLQEAIADAGHSVASVLEKVQLPAEMASRYPHQLSGGQRQRVCIARAIARQPRLLFADEPTSALDVSVQAEIIQLLDQLRKQTGMTLVVISHDLAMVNMLCDRVVVMRNGEIVEDGVTSEVLRSPTHPYTRELLAAIPKGLAAKVN